MAEFLASPLANLVILVAVVAALVAVGFYVIARVRSGVRSKSPPSSEWMTKFRDLHSQGELSDEEYRTIKAMLSERLQRELNSTDKPQ